MTTSGLVRRVLAITVTAVGLFSVTAPGADAGSWSSAQQLTSAPSSAPLALFTSAGEALVVWGPSTPAYQWGPAGPALSGAGGDAVVRVAVKEPGASFGPAQVLGTSGATFYSMFANPDGSVVVQWIDQNGLQSATRAPFGNFGQPTVLVPAAELAAAGPGSEKPTPPGVEVSVDRLGDVLLVWGIATTSASGQSTTAVWAQLRRAGGTFEAPVKIFENAPTGAPTFEPALDDHGDAFIGVTGMPAGSGATGAGAYAIERPAAGGYSEPERRSDPGETVRTALFPSAFGPQPFTVDGRGDVVFAWEASPPGAQGAVSIRAAVREHGQWLKTQTVWTRLPGPSGGLSMGTYVSAAWGPTGQLGVAWINSDVFEFSYRPPGGPFGAAETMPGLPAFWPINLGFDSLGDTVALPIVTVPTAVNVEGFVSATVRPPSGRFQPLQQFTAVVNGTAALTFDQFGDGVAAWTGPANGTSVIFAAYYDAAPPAVTQLALRANAIAHATRKVRSPRLTTVAFRLSKPGILRFSLQRVTCRRITTHHRHRTVCTTKKLADAKQVARAGASSAPLTSAMARALRTPGQYRLTATAIDGPGRTSAARTVNVQVR